MTVTNNLQTALDARNANTPQLVVADATVTTTQSLASQLNIQPVVAAAPTEAAATLAPTSEPTATFSTPQETIQATTGVSATDAALLERIAQMSAYVEPTPTPSDGSVVRQTVPTAEYPHKIRLKMIDDFDLHMEAYEYLLLTYNQDTPWIFPFFPEMAHEVQFIGLIEGISPDHTLRIYISPDAHIHFPPELEYELDMNTMIYQKIMPEVDFT
jgi:hypothetical protein